MFRVVRYRRCWWRFESLADQHKWKCTQTVPGKKHVCLNPLSVLTLSSCYYHFCLFLSCVSFTVTITNRLLCFSLPDVAVPQQDSSWLCLCGLLLPHCHCRSFNRQQVQETLKENCVSSCLQKLSPQLCFLFHELLIKSWIFSIQLHCLVANRGNDVSCN